MRPIVLTPNKCLSPFVYRRMVRFGDTDAAKIVYTVKFFDFAMDALDSWFAEVLEHDWYTLNTECGVSCPFVSAGLDFRAPMRPGQEVNISVRVAHAGKSSLKLKLSGARPDGVVSFEGLWICVFTDPATLKSTPMPSAFKARIEAYARACRSLEDRYRPDTPELPFGHSV